MDVVQGFLLQFGSGIGIGMLYFLLIKSYKKIIRLKCKIQVLPHINQYV